MPSVAHRSLFPVNCHGNCFSDSAHKKGSFMSDTGLLLWMRRLLKYLKLSTDLLSAYKTCLRLCFAFVVAICCYCFYSGGCNCCSLKRKNTSSYKQKSLKKENGLELEMDLGAFVNLALTSHTVFFYLLKWLCSSARGKQKEWKFI